MKDKIVQQVVQCYGYATDCIKTEEVKSFLEKNDNCQLYMVCVTEHIGRKFTGFAKTYVSGNPYTTVFVSRCLNNLLTHKDVIGENKSDNKGYRWFVVDSKEKKANEVDLNHLYSLVFNDGDLFEKILRMMVIEMAMKDPHRYAHLIKKS